MCLRAKRSETRLPKSGNTSATISVELFQNWVGVWGGSDFLCGWKRNNQMNKLNILCMNSSFLTHLLTNCFQTQKTGYPGACQQGCFPQPHECMDNEWWKKQRAGEPELVVIVRPNPPKHTCINVLPELPVYIYSSCQFLLKITWLQNQEYQYKYKNMFCYTWSRIHWAHTCCLSVSSCQPPPRSGVFEDMSKMTSTWSCCLSRAKVP